MIPSYNDFLQLTRDKMYSFISNIYFNLSSTEHADLIIKCSNKYINLFTYPTFTHYNTNIDNQELKEFFLIKFFNAAALTYINDKSTSINMYEEILSDNRCPQDIKEWSLYNSGLLYSEINSKNDFTIPRIIHILFFGFTPFERHHYRCIKSMLNFMCNPEREEKDRYSLFIHTSFDPNTNLPTLNNSSNPYWNEIISHPSVRLIPAKIPEEIDGYPLHFFQYKADVYRLDVLYKYGGIYLDADLILIKPFDELINNNKFSFYICEENPPTAVKDDNITINAFIASIPGNPVIKLWKESIPSRIRNGTWAYHIRVNHAIWRDYPFRIAKYSIKIFSNEHFFNFSWQNTDIWKCNIKPLIKDSNYGFHLWETILNNEATNNIFLPGYEYNSNQKIPLDHLFDKVIIISTSDSVDRVKNSVKELNKANIPNEKIIINQSPRNTDFPIIGCRNSHINSIKYALENNYSSVLILEDDISFNPSYNYSDNSNLSLSYGISKPPPDWDILYLGGILTMPTGTYSNSNGLWCFNSNDCDWAKGTIWCNHAYIVRRHMYKPILEYFEKFINKLAEYFHSENIDKLAPNVGIDHFFTSIFHNKFNCFLNNEQVFIQTPTSDGKWTVNENFSWDTWAMKRWDDNDDFPNININWNEL